MRIFGLLFAVVFCVHASEPVSQWNPDCDTGRPKGYIPTDLEDALVQLRCTLDADVVRAMKALSEDEMTSRYHHGLGTGIRNDWGLWSGSHLAEYFKKIGLTHPDDMSGVILTSFWRRLNDQPLRVDDQIRHYQDYWAAAKFEPPPIDCPGGEEPSPIISVTRGEWTDPNAISYYTECPHHGWFRYMNDSSEWVFVGSLED